jgi:hypothetical protein
MVITNFLVRKLDDTHGELATARKLWANPEFIPSDEYWLATFEVESQKYQAGIRRGRSQILKLRGGGLGRWGWR